MGDCQGLVDASQVELDAREHELGAQHPPEAEKQEREGGSSVRTVPASAQSPYWRGVADGQAFTRGLLGLAEFSLLSPTT